MYSKFFVSLLFAIGVSVAACGPSDDQQQQQEMPEQEQQMEAEQQPQVDVPEEELTEFAEATIEVMENQINPASDQEEMERVLEDKELNLERFLELNNVMQQDPALQQRVQDKIAELQQDGDGAAY